MKSSQILRNLLISPYIGLRILKPHIPEHPFPPAGHRCIYQGLLLVLGPCYALYSKFVLGKGPHVYQYGIIHLFTHF